MVMANNNLGLSDERYNKLVSGFEKDNNWWRWSSSPENWNQKANDYVMQKQKETEYTTAVMELKIKEK
jgi:hypothetical protein